MRVLFNEDFLILPHLEVNFGAFLLFLGAIGAIGFRSKNSFGLNSCRRKLFFLYLKLYLAFLILFRVGGSLVGGWRD